MNLVVNKITKYWNNNTFYVLTDAHDYKVFQSQKTAINYFINSISERLNQGKIIKFSTFSTDENNNISFQDIELKEKLDFDLANELQNRYRFLYHEITPADHNAAWGDSCSMKELTIKPASFIPDESQNLH